MARAGPRRRVRGSLGAAILVALFGLLALTGHAAFHGLLGRTTVSAAMALAHAATVLLVPVISHSGAAW